MGGSSTISTSEPMIGALRIQQSTQGRPVPIIYGRPRVSGNLLWFGDFQAIAQTTTESSGGKGGGITQENTTYSYKAAIIYGLGEGPLHNIRSAWRGKERLFGASVSGYLVTVENAEFTIPTIAPYTVAVPEGSAFRNNVHVYMPTWDHWLRPGVDYTVSASGVYTFFPVEEYFPPMPGYLVRITYQYEVPGYSLTALQQLNLSLQPGIIGQPIWSHLTADHPAEAIGYSGMAYLYSADYSLAKNAEMHQHSFEVDARLQFSVSIPDACPGDVVPDFLINPNYGVEFPAPKLFTTALYKSYCAAAGIFFSPVINEQRPAYEHLRDWFQMTNSEPVWSEGVLKIIPYGDEALSGNGYTYTPNLTPVYDLTDDDFLGDADDPVRVEPIDDGEVFNRIHIEFIDRANQYNIQIATASDHASIELDGLRPAPVIKAHAIHEMSVALRCAHIILQRKLYIRKRYFFDLPWKFVRLEPMDIVTLTDPGLNLNRTPVRIVETVEDPDGDISIVAESVALGSAEAPLYPSQTGIGYAHDYNSEAGNVNVPVIFEPPFQLVDDLQLWVAVSGSGSFWGGCAVWVSYDNANYRNVGTIFGAARHGVLSANFPAGAAIDIVNSLSVDMSVSRAELLSATQDDADNLRTLCWIDGGELIAYQTATLVSANKYNLTYLRRGAHSSPIQSHFPGQRFVRLDQAIFKYPFNIADIGKTIWIKFQSFNIYRGGYQDLADITAYNYMIGGTALTSPLANVINLATNLVAGITNLYWSAISDLRTPIDYEIRFGPSWEAGRFLTRTPLLTMPAVGDGTYWVAAHYRHARGFDLYSAVPASIVIAGATLTKNVIASYEQAPGWTGAFSGGAGKSGASIQLGGSANYLSSANILAETDILYMGGVAASGYYDIPPAHRVNIGRVAACTVLMLTTSVASSVYDNVLTYPDYLAVTDLLGDLLGPKVRVQPQIRLAQSNGIYGDWMNFVPGQYSAQYFDGRLLLESTDTQVTPIVSQFSFSIDVPDRIEEFTNIAIPSGGLTVTYSAPFNAVPNVQVTILAAQQHDDVIMSQTINDVTVQVINGGAGVARNVNIFAQSY